MRHFALILLFAAAPLLAEIESITVNWDPINCNQSCANLLRQKMMEIDGVEEVAVSQPAGTATVKWKPGVRFSFQSFNIAFRLVGPNLDRISLKVKGEIRPHDNGVSLISEGDGTKFELLTPLNPTQHEAVVEESAASHQLSADQMRQFTDAAKAGKLAVVNGPMLGPTRAPPNYIIIQSIDFVEPEKQGKKSRSRRLN